MNRFNNNYGKQMSFSIVYRLFIHLFSVNVSTYNFVCFFGSFLFSYSRDKNYHESMYQMQCGDLDTFRNFFIFGSPKFISPCPPPNDATEGDFIKQPMEHQTQVFMDEVKQQQELPTIRSYLKLYTTLPLEKLAAFMNKEPAERDISNLLTHLLCFKHKMKNLVWTEGSSGLDGKFVSGSELDFYIDLDMIHIADTKVAHRYGEFFIRKILKFGDLNRRLHNLKI